MDAARSRNDRRSRFLLLLALGVILALGAKPLAFATGVLGVFESQTPARLDAPLREACRMAGVAHPPPAPRLEVLKSKRLMRLYSGKTLVKEYPISLGFAPAGDKLRQGDGRTPEGSFYICTRLDRSRFHRFMGLSYPAVEDAERGRKDRLISSAEKASIIAAWRRKRQPPWGTKLGGAIGIHGGGTAVDWTWGCIALSDEHVAELFQVLGLRTPVRIHA
jgi:hypothetical protein